MALSAALTRWMCGGTHWNDMSYFLNADVRSSDISLSKINLLKMCPCFVNVSKKSFQTVLIVAACRLGMPLTRILLES